MTHIGEREMATLQDRTVQSLSETVRQRDRQLTDLSAENLVLRERVRVLELQADEHVREKARLEMQVADLLDNVARLREALEKGWKMAARKEPQ